MTNMTLQLLVT